MIGADQNSRVWSVGLTGGIASGKSTVAELFRALGVTVVDTDELNARLIGPGGRALPILRDAFGSDFVRSDEGLDRARMRAAAFRDPSVRERLEHILHPLIREEAERALAEAKSQYAILVIPLLFETGFYEDRLDRFLVVDTDETTQRLRALQRPGLTTEQVDAILSIQCSREERRARADDLIENVGDLMALEAVVRRLHEQYLSISRGQSPNLSKKG